MTIKRVAQSFGVRYSARIDPPVSGGSMSNATYEFNVTLEADLAANESVVAAQQALYEEAKACVQRSIDTLKETDAAFAAVLSVHTEALRKREILRKNSGA